MDKNEKSILLNFFKLKTPKDFYDTFEKQQMMDSILGIIDCAINGINISNDSKNYELTKEEKESISKYLNYSIDNQIYYNYLKTCILILKKQTEANNL